MTAASPHDPDDPDRRDDGEDVDFPLPGHSRNDGGERAGDGPFADDPDEDDPFADGPFAEDDPDADDPFGDAPPDRNPFDLGGDELPPPPPPADPFGTPDPGAEPTETYSLGEATVPPKWGVDLNEAPAAPPVKRRPKASAPAAKPVAVKPVAPVVDDEDEDFGDAPPARTKSGGKAGPAKPKLRDWLEERCKKEAKMYALGAAVLAPVGLAAVGLTWLVLYVIAPGSGVIAALFATVILAALFWVNRQAGDARTIRVHVEPGDRDIKPVTVDVPRGSGLTWLMYLTGSRDLPGILQFLGTITLFGPRLCDLAYQMGRTAQELWTIDVDAIADPVKTLVRADGKVSFAAFLEAHKKLSPQGLVDRLGKIDGVLFLPTSQPPGLCVSNAMKDEFAAWRSKWQERRTAGDRLYD